MNIEGSCSSVMSDTDTPGEDDFYLAEKQHASFDYDLAIKELSDTDECKAPVVTQESPATTSKPFIPSENSDESRQQEKDAHSIKNAAKTTKMLWPFANRKAWNLKNPRQTIMHKNAMTMTMMLRIWKNHPRMIAFLKNQSCMIENCVEKDDDPLHRPKHVKGTPRHMQKRNWHVTTNEVGETVGKWVSDKTIKELQKLEKRRESLLNPAKSAKPRKRKACMARLSKTLEESKTLIKRWEAEQKARDEDEKAMEHKSKSRMDKDLGKNRSSGHFRHGGM